MSGAVRQVVYFSKPSLQKRILQIKVFTIGSRDPIKNWRSRNPLVAYSTFTVRKWIGAFWSETSGNNWNGRKLYLPEARTLGEKLSTNAMAYVRGNKAGLWWKWASFGCWIGIRDYESVLPISKVGAQRRYPHWFSWRLRPLNVTFAKGLETPFCRRCRSLCRDGGIPANPGFYNEKKSRRSKSFQFTIKNGFDIARLQAFSQPILKRPN